MDGQAIKNFFAKHIEKMALVGVAGISGFLLYQGLQQPMYDKQEPASLESMATQVKRSVDEDHTAAIMEPRQVEADFVEQVNKAQEPVPAEVYEPPYVWDPRPVDTSIKRQDPQLLAPADIRVMGVVGAIAYKSANGVYPLADLENADPIEKERPKPERRGRRGRGAQAAGGYGGGYGDLYGGGETAGGYGASGYGGGYGAGGPAGGPAGRKLAADYNLGYKPTGAVGSTGTPPPGQAYTVPQHAYFIAGTAVMPHKKLLEAYEAALKDAVEYNPKRDQPVYLSFEVRRADVTDAPLDQQKTVTWETRGNALYYNTMARTRWAGFAPEIVPGDYRDQVLTPVIPPLLIHDYSRFSTHPLVPLQSMMELRQQALPTNAAPVIPDEPLLPGQEAELLSDPTALLQRAMTAPGGGGYGGGYGGGGYGGGGYGGGGYGGGGYGGNLYGGGVTAVASKNAPEYKLIRFYDFALQGDPKAPKPGRKYVYQVRVALEDPNFPQALVLEPSPSSLSPEVYQRFAAKKADEQAQKKRDFMIWTDWSEASPMAELPPMAFAYAGPVEPGSSKWITVQNRQIEYSRTPAKASMVAVQWSPGYATAVPAPMDAVTPGSVLNTAEPITAEVIDPITTTIKKLPDAKVQTGAVVLDIDGGEKLEFVDEDEQTKPGMMLVFGPGGELEVREEISDRREFRMYTFAEEHEAAAATPAPAGGYNGGYGGGYGGGGGGGGYGGGSY